MAQDLARPAEHRQHVAWSRCSWALGSGCSQPLVLAARERLALGAASLAVGFPGTDPRAETHLDAGWSGTPSWPRHSLSELGHTSERKWVGNRGCGRGWGWKGPAHPASRVGVLSGNEA